MVPDDVPAQVRATLLAPSIMGPTIVWLCSDAAAEVQDEGIVARDFDAWLGARDARTPVET